MKVRGTVLVFETNDEYKQWLKDKEAKPTKTVKAKVVAAKKEGK